MFPTIYNMIMILIITVIYYSGYSTYLAPLYLFLCFGAIFSTYRIDQWIKRYPNLNTQYKEAVELIFDKSEYTLRLWNFIVSGICHSLIIGLLLQNYSVLSAVICVTIYRIISLIQAYNKVEVYKNE